MEHELRDGERRDRIGFGELQLIQDPEDFCYGVDAVLLSDFARQIKKGARVVDLGTGGGIVPLILSHKTEAGELWGVELQSKLAELAERNVAENGLEHRIRILNEDVKHIVPILGKGCADAVTSNPPYVEGGTGLKGSSSTKMIARHETTACLEDFIRTAAELLREKGDFYMVHRPSRLADIVVLCRKYRLEPKELRFVSPGARKAPNILLIHCVKYGGTELKVLDPLYVYGEDGRYSDEIMKIYERQ